MNKTSELVKKFLNRVDKLPKNLPLILIGISFILSLIKIVIYGIQYGNIVDFLVPSTVDILVNIVVFIFVYALYVTDKRSGNHARFDMHKGLKWFWIIILSLLTLSGLSDFVSSLLMIVWVRSWDINLVLNVLWSLLQFLGCGISLLTAISWKTAVNTNNKTHESTISIKHIVIIILILLGIYGFINNQINPTTTYYYDENGNGKEDWGEGVWYEDKDGVHFFD